MKKKDTKEAILDAAEELFAGDGYKNTTLRSITAAAAVNLAAVNYHFGSKKSLLESVFSRRLKPLNRGRMMDLREIEERCDREGGEPSTSEVLKAFMLPVLRFRQSVAGGGHFTLLVGRALTEPDATVRKIFVGQMKPVFTLCFGLLCRALPHLSPQVVFCRFNFALGAMSRGMCLAVDAPILPDGFTVPPDGDVVSDNLFTFIATGMEAR